MKTSHAILIAALVIVAPWAFAQIQFPDGSIQSTAGQPALVSTVVVSPVGTDLENGTALKAAYEAVAGATADAPVLVKVEPGTYDLGAGNIDLIEYVNLEGSGVESTIIKSSQNDASIGVLDFFDQAGVVEVRHLTVMHTGTNLGLGIYNGVTMYLKDVEIEMSGARTGNTFGVYNDGYVQLRDSVVTINGYTSSGPNVAVFGVSNTFYCEVFSSTLRVSGSDATWVAGLYNQEGTTVLRNSTSTGFDSTSVSGSYGIWGDTDIIYAAACELDGTDGPDGSLATFSTIVNCWDFSFNAIADY